MYCYTKDFGAVKFAICEEQHQSGAVMTATECLASDPTPDTWARLGAVLAKSGEILEAQ